MEGEEKPGMGFHSKRQLEASSALDEKAVDSRGSWELPGHEGGKDGKEEPGYSSDDECAPHFPFPISHFPKTLP